MRVDVEITHTRTLYACTHTHTHLVYLHISTFPHPLTLPHTLLHTLSQHIEPAPTSGPRPTNKKSVHYLSVQGPENVERNQWTVTSNISGNLALFEVSSQVKDSLYRQ